MGGYGSSKAFFGSTSNPFQSESFCGATERCDFRNDLSLWEAQNVAMPHFGSPNGLHRHDDLRLWKKTVPLLKPGKDSAPLLSLWEAGDSGPLLILISRISPREEK